MKKFIGDKEIFTVHESTLKTPIGNDMVVAEFTDGTRSLMPKALCERLQNDSPIDLTALRKQWVDPFVNQVIVLMQENDIKMDDVGYFMDLLAMSIDDKSNRANAHLFGVDFYPQRSMLAIERVLEDAANKPQPIKPSETGSGEATA